MSKTLKTIFVCLYFNYHTKSKLYILKVIFEFYLFPSFIFLQCIPNKFQVTHTTNSDSENILLYIYLYTIVNYIYNTPCSKQYLRQLICVKCFTKYCHIQLCEMCYYSHSTSEFTESKKDWMTKIRIKSQWIKDISKFFNLDTHNLPTVPCYWYPQIELHWDLHHKHRNGIRKGWKI